MGFSVYTLAGFFGVVLVLVAFFANQQRWLNSEDWRFPFVNALGSGLILVSLYEQWNFPSFIINLSWIAISLYGLVRGARGRMSS